MLVVLDERSEDHKNHYNISSGDHECLTLSNFKAIHQIIVVILCIYYVVYNITLDKSGGLTDDVYFENNNS